MKQYIFDKDLSPNSNMLIERFNKTLRGLLDKYMSLNKTKKYIDALQDLVYNYNNTTHASTKEVPNDLDQQKYLDLDAHIQKQQKLEEASNKIHVNDDIRILKQKKG